jgi:hypothetical protein
LRLTQTHGQADAFLIEILKKALLPSQRLAACETFNRLGIERMKNPTEIIDTLINSSCHDTAVNVRDTCMTSLLRLTDEAEVYQLLQKFPRACERLV